MGDETVRNSGECVKATERAACVGSGGGVTMGAKGDKSQVVSRVMASNAAIVCETDRQTDSDAQEPIC